ncbi:MAG: hypothetical protein EOM24_04105 [Chloroflexia bacterium]|nr:hypothetical protein [Chloroflexia bacterium]
MSAFLQTLIADRIVLAPSHHTTIHDTASRERPLLLPITNPTLAHAIYSRLDRHHLAEQYTLSIVVGMRVQALLLIPLHHYERGFLARMTLFGPGLPRGGLAPQSIYLPFTIEGRTYQLIQAHLPPLPMSGSYTLRIHRSDGEGVYCLCLGDQAYGPADAAMRERIDRLLND